MLYLATEEGIAIFNDAAHLNWLGTRRFSFRSIAPHPRNPEWAVGASDEGGLFLWNGKDLENVMEGVAHSVAWCSDGTCVFAGLRGVHLYMSKDGGRNWEERPRAHASMKKPGVPLPHVEGHPLDILSILLPRKDILYIGVEAGGLLRSRDGGGTFEPASNGLHPDIHSLAVDPRNSGVVYAATGHTLFRTIDGGDSWVRSDQGMDRHYLAAIFVLPTSPEIVLASGAPDSPLHHRRPGGAKAVMFRSADGGTNWHRVAEGVPESFEEEIMAFAADPGFPGRIMAATLGGDLLESSDEGVSWRFAAKGLPGIWGMNFA